MLRFLGHIKNLLEKAAASRKRGYMWGVGKAHTPHIPFPSSRLDFFHGSYINQWAEAIGHIMLRCLFLIIEICFRSGFCIPLWTSSAGKPEVIARSVIPQSGAAGDPLHSRAQVYRG